MKITTGKSFSKATENARKDFTDIFQKMTAGMRKKELRIRKAERETEHADMSVKGNVPVTEELAQHVEVAEPVDYTEMINEVIESSKAIGNNVESLHSEIYRNNMAITDCARKIERFDVKPVDLSGVIGELANLGEEVRIVKSAVEEFSNSEDSNYKKLNIAIAEMDRSISKSVESIKSDVSVMIKEHNHFVDGYHKKINILYGINILMLAGIIFAIIQLL